MIDLTHVSKEQTNVPCGWQCPVCKRVYAPWVEACERHISVPVPQPHQITLVEAVPHWEIGRPLPRPDPLGYIDPRAYSDPHYYSSVRLYSDPPVIFGAPE